MARLNKALCISSDIWQIKERQTNKIENYSDCFFFSLKGRVRSIQQSMSRGKNYDKGTSLAALVLEL